MRKKINFVFMRVEQYIEQLLYRHECVIVPGIGAFITQKKGAKYFSDTHTFSPPSRKITFNKSIQNQDGLLAETIAKGESMDFESANVKIQRFVYDFKTALEIDRVLKIPKIGRFHLDQEDKLSFEPNSQVNYFLDAFGFDQISLETVSKAAVSITSTNSQSKVEVKTLDTSNVDKVNPPVNFEQESTKDKKGKSYLRYAAVGVIALGVAGFAGLYKYNNYVVSYNDVEAQKAESLLQERIQSAEFNYTLSELPLSTVKLDKLKPKYHVIAGAFRVKSNATKKVELLKNKGYEASLLGANAYGLHQVAFASFSDRTEALAQLRKIKSTENPEAWLYVKQL